MRKRKLKARIKVLEAQIKLFEARVWVLEQAWPYTPPVEGGQPQTFTVTSTPPLDTVTHIPGAGRYSWGTIDA